jgi:hypothetical protein
VQDRFQGLAGLADHREVAEACRDHQARKSARRKPVLPPRDRTRQQQQGHRTAFSLHHQIDARARTDQTAPGIGHRPEP